MHTLLAFCLLFVSLQSTAQELNSRSNRNIVLRDSDYAFSISLPPNWALDTTDRALQAAAKAVLYSTEEGKENWRIVVLIATKRIEGKNTLANLLAYLAKLDSSQNVRTVGTDSPTLFTKDNKRAIVKCSKSSGGQSAHAYIDDLNVVVMFGQWPIEEGLYQPALNTFKHVVESYSSVTPDEGKKK